MQREVAGCWRRTLYEMPVRALLFPNQGVAILARLGVFNSLKILGHGTECRVAADGGDGPVRTRFFDQSTMFGYSS